MSMYHVTVSLLILDLFLQNVSISLLIWQSEVQFWQFYKCTP